MKRIFLTTTSYQDTPGPHHKMLKRADFEIIPARGPLSETEMLAAVGEMDALLCGDDALTRKVMEKALPRLKVISKYGIGLDKIDLKAATEFKIPVLFTPGVNHTTVAEHTFCLLLAIYRNVVAECNHVKNGEWKRITGHELFGKTMGLIGMGRIGREVATRARAFGMNVIGFGNFWDEEFAAAHQIRRVTNLQLLASESDILSLHTMLGEKTRHIINAALIANMKPDAVLLNCARGELVDQVALVDALKKGRILGYGADVLDEEPPPANHPLFTCPNAILTPHIGSRTFESVVRQASMATENLTLFLDGKMPLAQANSF